MSSGHLLKLLQCLDQHISDCDTTWNKGSSSDRSSNPTALQAFRHCIRLTEVGGSSTPALHARAENSLQLRQSIRYLQFVGHTLACLLSCAMRAMVDSEAGLVAFTTRAPSSTLAPEGSSSPRTFRTGTASPVMLSVLTLASPDTICPSSATCKRHATG